MRLIPAIIAVIVSAVATDARAQDRVGVTIQAGLVGGEDSAPLASFSRPLLTASVQRVFGGHFVLEGEASYWTLERVIERGPHGIEGPQGVIGSVSRSRVVDSHAFFNYGVNALVRWGAAVRVFGGGGVGLSTDRNIYRQQSFGCSPSLDPRTCDEFVNHTGRGPIVMLRVLGGLEVPVTGTVQLVGTARWERTAWEDRSKWLSATAGVRVAF